MNTLHPSDDRLRRQAATYLTRRDAGWAEEDAAAFALWRAADPAHEAAVRQVESAQQLLRHLPRSPGAGSMLREIDALYASRQRRRLFRWGLWTGALAAAACLALVLWLIHPRTEGGTRFAALDHVETVDLNDGSTLRLNPGSRVDVRFRDRERHVVLERGDVRFSVAKDAARPFIVAAGDTRVRVVGTAFSVQRTAAQVEVKVTEGKVQVTRTDSGGPDAAPIFLVAGESATLTTGGVSSVRVARLPSPVVGATVATAAPRLEFSNTPLSDAVARFNEYSRLQIDIGDPDLAGRPIGGTFDGDQAEAFVNLLVASGDVRIERISETHIVLRKTR